MNNRQVALRDGDWKIVARWDGPGNFPSGGSLRPGVVSQLKASKLEHFELYNIAEDIAESHDLAKSNPEQLQRLSKQAQRLYQEVLTEGPFWYGAQ